MPAHFQVHAFPALRRLIKAAAEQRAPSPQLMTAVNEILTLTNHAWAPKGRKKMPVHDTGEVAA